MWWTIRVGWSYPGLLWDVGESYARKAQMCINDKEPPPSLARNTPVKITETLLRCFVLYSPYSINYQEVQDSKLKGWIKLPKMVRYIAIVCENATDET